MRLFRCIILSSEWQQCEAVLPFVRCDGIFRVHLCSPRIVTTYAHLLVVDVQPHHIFLHYASSVAAFHLRRAVLDIFHREVPGTDT